MLAVTLGSSEIDRMRAAGRAAAATLAHVASRVRTGITTAAIDAWVRRHTASLGARPSQLGYHGFPASTCTSRNHVVCHGIPSAHEHVIAGDILNVDITSELAGFHGDTSATFMFEPVTDEVRRLVATTQRALRAAIDVVRPGARLGDIGAAIQAVAERENLGVVADYCGHGIGKHMHMPPQIPHVGKAGLGPRLHVGMAFTIEPMLTLGEPAVTLARDGWTVTTVDGRPSAQFEHTVLVTPEGVEVLTAQPMALADMVLADTRSQARASADEDE